MVRRITVTWLDGSRTTASSWPEAEKSVRAAQWSKYRSRAEFRVDMRHRCKIWAGIRPDIVTATSRNFLRALEASGLCRIDTE